MKFISLFLLITLAISFVYLPTILFYYQLENEASNEKIFFGVSFGGNTASQAKLLIDKVKGYTNFFLINNWDIALNETTLTEISQYAIDANLSIMVYYDLIPYKNQTWIQPWFDTAKERWGDQFLGVYLYDEPGGKQIESGQWRSGPTAEKLFVNVSDYSDAANRFTTAIPSSEFMQFVKYNSLSVFTSDFALYWFDYLAGYDSVFVELGWDHNRTQHIALGRGAANVQEKDWGAIIVWKSQDPEDEDKGVYKTGPEMLQDMLVAYQAGAKYVIVFNYPYEQPFGILEEEHFAAMETFWNKIRSPQQGSLEKVEGEVAFVLPKDYGWGMRTPNDNMWGIWEADNRSQLIWDNMNKLIERYGLKLDIIYDDARFSFEQKYSKIYLWNATDY